MVGFRVGLTGATAAVALTAAPGYANGYLPAVMSQLKPGQL
ncbi:hypothetical protein SAMN04487914_1506 [Arthrobacter sp. ok909]|nr:hypothetical protein SAMN04487914_1506 [Arthrobacter sp. ok909]